MYMYFKDFSCDHIKITAEFIQINYRVHNLVDYKSSIRAISERGSWSFLVNTAWNNDLPDLLKYMFTVPSL